MKMPRQLESGRVRSTTRQHLYRSWRGELHFKCNWLSVCIESTDHRLKIHDENCLYTEHIRTFFLLFPKNTIQLRFTECLHSIVLAFRYCNRYLRQWTYQEKWVILSHIWGGFSPWFIASVTLGLWWDSTWWRKHVAEQTVHMLAEKQRSNTPLLTSRPSTKLEFSLLLISATDKAQRL